MNNGKAPGLVEISAELLKCGGPGLNALLHRMFLSIGLKVFLRIGDMYFSSLCSKRVLGTFVTTIEELLYSLSLERFLPRDLLNCLEIHTTPSILPESQCSFRSGCGTVDMIFSARLLQKKCIELGLDLYQCFIDLAKTFDTVNCGMLWKVVGEDGLSTTICGPCSISSQ